MCRTDHPLDPRDSLAWPFPDRRPARALRLLIEHLWLLALPTLVALYLLVVTATNSIDLSILAWPRLVQGLMAVALLVALGTGPYVLFRRRIDWIRYDLLLHREAAAALRDVQRWRRKHATESAAHRVSLVERACSHLRQALREGSPSRVHAHLNELEFALDAPRPVGRRGILREYLLSISAAVSLSLICKCFILAVYEVQSGSMLPALQYGDHIVISKWLRHLTWPWLRRGLLSRLGMPERGEVVLFAHPQNQSELLLGRVMAIPGDTIQICGGEINLNGQPLSREQLPGTCEYEDFTLTLPICPRGLVSCTAYRERNDRHEYLTLHHQGGGGRAATCNPAMTLAPGQIYVLGDNRDDGYFAGSVPLELLAGRAWIIFWSAGEKTSVRTERMFRRVADAP